MIDIENILREYKKNKSFVETAEARIEQYKYAIAHPEIWGKQYIPPSLPLGMPGKPRGSGTSSVESYVIEKSLDENTIREWIEQDESRIFFKKIEIEQIEKAMDQLSKQEKFIIELKYFEKMFWKDIECSYNNTYRQKNYVTHETLKKINKNAVNQLEEVLTPFYDCFQAKN